MEIRAPLLWPLPARRLARPAMLLLLPFILAACAVSFVSPYDALTEAAIQQAAVQAETIFAKVTVDKAPYAQVRPDYRALEGQLVVISARATEQGKKNVAEQSVVQLFQEEVRDLETFHREAGPYRSSQLAGARSILRSLLHHERGKKAATAGTEGGAQ